MAGESHSHETQAGYRLWRAGDATVEVLFTGRGPRASAAERLAAVAPEAPPVAWARQIHSDRVLAARPGDCGRGDALVARAGELALAVVTADCVPVVVAAPGRLAVVHAGWRGIAAGVVRRAVEALGAAAAGRLTAWIGPAIGPCCYEVGPEVAAAVATASGGAARIDRPGHRPHLDLARAVELQLADSGVAGVETLGLCTRCHPELLWSYRRDGAAAGRNLTFAWLRR